MDHGANIQVYRPDGDVEAVSFARAAGMDTLVGCRIAVLDNGKPNAGFVMTQAARYLAEEVDGTLGLIIRKGPGGRSANVAIPCAPDVFDRVVANADIVITGAADCGSCSAYSVSDTIQLERAGVPTVIVTTTHFERVVDTLAANGGMPSIRKLVLDHPIGGTDRLTLERRAGDATDRLIRLFSGPTPASESLHSNPYLPSVIDLEPLRALVAADGGDLQIDDVDTVAGTVRLRLILPDASCRTCVMPSEVLSNIAFDRLSDSIPGLRSVVVLDPRDEPTDAKGPK